MHCTSERRHPRENNTDDGGEFYGASAVSMFNVQCSGPLEQTAQYHADDDKRAGGDHE